MWDQRLLVRSTTDEDGIARPNRGCCTTQRPVGDGIPAPARPLGRVVGPHTVNRQAGIHMDCRPEGQFRSTKYREQGK
ncbi:MAG: hypothetical protein HZB37_02275 [Planctomycetes bacterium]|nr:hypothetical protein [Planctomycetota bacterium]